MVHTIPEGSGSPTGFGQTIRKKFRAQETPTTPNIKRHVGHLISNELGRSRQVIGKGTVGSKNQRIKGIGTFKVVRFNDIPFEKRKDIFHTRVVCEYRPDKDDSNRKRITIAGGHILVPFDVSTPTGSLELVKLMINSVLSRQNARFADFDIKNFYFDTPMDNPEYVRVKLEDIPKELIEEYNLLDNEHHGWVYFEIVRGCYGLPQSGKLANDLIRTRLEDAHYYETATTPGLWHHKWISIQICAHS